MSPVFAHGHLRLYLLVLLAERPMHGYEVIQALGERFGGTYVPSAGTVYPRLAKLEEDGLVTASADGRKTVYAITDAGRAELSSRQDDVATVEAGVTDSVRSLADGVRASVGEAMRSLRADLAASARQPTRPRGLRWPSPGHPSSPGWSTDSSDASFWGASSTGPSSASASSGDASSGHASFRHLAEAEVLLATFRQDVASDLRRRAARGRLDGATVAALAEGLQALRSRLDG